MEEVLYQANLDAVIPYLEAILKNHASSDALVWFKTKQEQIFTEKKDLVLFMTFSTIPSFFDKTELTLTPAELEKANQLRKYWNPNFWSVAQFARTYLLLVFARHQLERFKEVIDKIFIAADVYELITLYQALPLFPYPKKFLLQATNGIRSNMTSVFDSVALNNPYPSDYFDDIAWNQLILKVFFVDSPIEKVIGVTRRANPQLAKALINTVRERLSAHREVKPEIWCLIGLSLDKETWLLLKKFADESNDPQFKNGILLACDHSQLPEAKKFFDSNEKTLLNMQEQLKKLREFEQQLE